MILNYLGENQQYLTECLAETLGDEVVSLSERSDQGLTDSLFSGKAYLFIMDMRKPIPQAVVDNITRTELSGSKTVYFLFITSALADKLNNTAEMLARRKNLVLFGYDTIHLDRQGFLNTAECRKLVKNAEFIRDYRPIAPRDELGFPVYPKKRSKRGELKYADIK